MPFNNNDIFNNLIAWLSQLIKIKQSHVTL